ncbi:MAG: hypothetical protein NT138_20080 [Planctomycetales bacterium]|nr:hypothetical protein [Planctomycetales bacterium]
MKRYLDGETEREIREALRHEDFDIVAAKTQFDPDELRRLLNLPAKSSANMVAEPTTDLWAVEKLEGQL